MGVKSILGGVFRISLFEIQCSFARIYKTFLGGVTFLASKNPGNPKNSGIPDFEKPLQKVEFYKFTWGIRHLNFTNYRDWKSNRLFK